MPQLNVNIDHVATVRQARMVDEPNPVWAAVECELGGASGITMHLREDRRHIQDRDVQVVKQVAGVKLNLEMACEEEVVRIACDSKSDQATLVPERREEVTTEGGLNLVDASPSMGEMVATLKDADIMVTAFLDPDTAQIQQAARIGYDAVEIHTGAYANAPRPKVGLELEKLHEAARAIRHLGMAVHAGHGLNYHNTAPILDLPHIEELNIGHSIISRAVFVGMDRAVRDMLNVMGRI
jgi:pyridoxine 5-phosphate synthase